MPIPCHEVVFFAIINQPSSEEELAVNLSEPANKFVALERLSVRVGNNLAMDSLLKSRQFREQSLTLALKLGYSLMVWR